MTNVKFFKRSSFYTGFLIEGHAMPRESEAQIDLICNSISVISQTTLIGILEVLHIDVKYEIHDGYMNLTLDNNSDDDIKNCQVLMETMLLGLQSIEFSYGDYIKVEVEEV